MWFQGSVSCLTTGRSISSGDLGLGVLSTSETIYGTMVTRSRSIGKGLYSRSCVFSQFASLMHNSDSNIPTNKYWTGDSIGYQLHI